ncbi:MAG: NRDE family protein [Jatrophihabitans sp.]
MCTVVCRHSPGDPVEILALRDEFVARAFDGPGAWWPDQPSVIGGRDRTAGGSWCVSDLDSGLTALLVNRIERFEGTPSRGLLPLAAVAHRDGWTEHVDHTGMASFNLMLAGPDGVTVWVWDAVDLRRVDLDAGTHMITSRGVDADDAKTQRFAPQFERGKWIDVVTACEPSSAEGSLVVRHEHEGRTYATVFGQLITATPGALRIAHTRTPWQAGTWVEQTWP